MKTVVKVIAIVLSIAFALGVVAALDNYIDDRINAAYEEGYQFGHEEGYSIGHAEGYGVGTEAICKWINLEFDSIQLGESDTFVRGDSQWAVTRIN